MKISSIIDIIDGEELNSPSISFIYSFKTKVKKVKEGDLFFAFNEDDIQKAIDNGAFAIVTQNYVSVTDFEIAWIKVENLKEAIIKLLRFRLSSYDLNVFYCDIVTYKYLEVLKSSNSNIKLVDDCINETLRILDDLEENKTLVFNNKELMNKIYPKNEEIIINTDLIKNIVEHTFFETSFTFDDIYFSKIRIPSLYINEFLKAYIFLDDETVDFHKLKATSFFKPLFVDKSIHQIEYGKSSKFIICQENKDLIEEEINHIKKKFKYAKTLFITNEYLNNFYAKQNVIKNINNIKEFLKTNDFNVAYIIGYNYNELHEIIKEANNQLTLL